MSAVASPFGLKPAWHPSGCVRQAVGRIDSGFATDIFQFSPVGIDANGFIVPVAPTEVATTGRIVGAFMGVEWTGSDGRRRVNNMWDANTIGTEIVAYYTQDPYIVYQIQADTTLDLDSMGGRFNWSALTGNDTTGLSSVSLDVASTTAAGLRVMGLNPAPDNAFGDAFPILQVLIAKHQYVASEAAV